MTKINLDELMADREAGTGGEWAVDEPSSLSFTIRAPIFGGVCKVFGSNKTCTANARRIARLPDLEAAYIEAVELLRDIEESLTADNTYRLLREAARNFLEKNS